MGKQNIIPSLEKGLKVLDIITSSLQGITAERLHSTTQISMTTLLRILKTFEKNGYITKKQGCFMLSIGCRIGREKFISHIREIAMPYLKKLLHTTGETVEFGILEGGKIFYVAKLEADDYSVKMLFEEGKFYRHMHASGICKVMLAFLSEQEIESIVKRDGMKKFTPKTITDLPTLLKNLKPIRTQSGSIEIEENRTGVKRISAPIFFKDNIFGPKGFVGPVSKLSLHIKDSEILKKIKKYTQKISQDLNKDINQKR